MKTKLSGKFWCALTLFSLIGQVAYLRAILPEKVGKDLTEQIFKLLFLHVKGELIDLKGAFHIQD